MDTCFGLIGDNGVPGPNVGEATHGSCKGWPLIFQRMGRWNGRRSLICWGPKDKQKGLRHQFKSVADRDGQFTGLDHWMTADSEKRVIH